MRAASLVFLASLSFVVSCGSKECTPAPCNCPPAAVASAPAPATSAHVDEPASADPTFLRTLAETRNFRLGTPRNVTVTPDGKSVLFLRSKARDPKQVLYETDLATGETRELLAPESVIKGPETLSPEEKARRERLRISASGFTAFELSEDGSKVLLPLSGRLFVLVRATRAIVELPTGEGAAFDPHFSRDGAHVAYVRAGDLHVVASDGKGKERAITKGATDDVTHALAEFVAQEEFDRQRGFWWSPDGAQLLYEEVDSRKVERLTIVDPAHPESAPDRPAYPRAGKTNATTRFGLVSTAGGKTTWIEWNHQEFPYVVHVAWPKSGALTLHVMDRAQRHAQLLAVDAKSGATKVLIEERDDAFLNLDESTPAWLPDGKSFLWSTERTGTWRLELHDASGKLVRELADANLGYRELLRVDADKKIAYVAASAEPTERHLFALPLDGGAAKPLDDGGAVVAMPKFGSDAVFAGYEGTREGVRRWMARSVDGKVARAIPSVAEEPKAVPAQLLSVGPDAMRVIVLRPRNFVPGKKLPVIDSAYGGPHVAIVSADGAANARDQWIADATGAIVVKIDAKGTPFRGRAWERAITDHFHDVPIEGHIAALRALADKVPEMDLARVGAIGWSFGGYFTAMAVLSRPDVFKVGVAGAPVVDWHDYDTAYTERYLGMPDANAKVYQLADVQTWAKRAISGDAPVRPLLVIHGTADDNVFFSNSLKLTQAMALASRPFEFLPLVGQTHQLSTAQANEIVWGRAVAFLRSGLR